MKEALSFLFGFTLGAAFVVLTGSRIVAEIRKTKLEMTSAIDRVLQALQAKIG